MPILFSLGIHDALQSVHSQLADGELLFAFLDDVYVLAEPDRVRTLYNLLEAAFREHCGIELNAGKTRAWNAAGSPPPDLEDLGAEVWDPHGIKVLGTPVGADDFVRACTTERVNSERDLLAALQEVPDLQSAWQILVQSAGPRCNHLLRTLPPSQSAEYAQAHDQAMWQSVKNLLGLTSAEMHSPELATLPMRLGGLGVRSAARTAIAAFWASWADAIEMIQQRCPQLAADILAELSNGPSTPCLLELEAAEQQLRREQILDRPTWPDFAQGRRPAPRAQERELGEWSQGWQFFAASAREHHFRRSRFGTNEVLMARLRSRSGPGSSAALSGCPTCPEYTIAASEFRTLLLDRLYLPLPATTHRCEGCGDVLDTRGHHLTACTKTGRVRKRAMPIERTVARACREAGGATRTEVMLKDMNIGVAASDKRRMDVLVQGLPCFAGAQIAVDATLRSSISSSGLPQGRAASEDGQTCIAAVRDKDSKYPELVAGGRCKLVVFALEVGGRFGKEALELLDQLAWAKSRSASPLTRSAALLAWRRRWIRMIAISAGVAWARSVTAPTETVPDGPCDGHEPPQDSVLSDARRC